MTEQIDLRIDPRDRTYSITDCTVLSSQDGLEERHFNFARENKDKTDGVIVDRFELTPVLHLKLSYVKKPEQ